MTGRQTAGDDAVVELAAFNRHIRRTDRGFRPPIGITVVNISCLPHRRGNPAPPPRKLKPLKYNGICRLLLHCACCRFTTQDRFLSLTIPEAEKKLHVQKHRRLHPGDPE